MINAVSSCSRGLSRVELFLLIFMLAVLFAFLGRPVPFNNEYVYLLRLVKGFLPNDWTFSSAADEHAVFNFLFSIPSTILSIEQVGWLGRLLSWIGCGIGIILLARFWRLTAVGAGISFALWILIGQSVVNGEWIFGGFEAKTIAYVFLLAALWATASERLSLGAVLFGLTFSFHPAVGLWSILAAAVSILVVQRSAFLVLRFYFLMAVAALPGVLPLIRDEISVDGNFAANWQFLVTTAIAHHLDPYSYSRSEFAGLCIMFLFATVFMLRSGSAALSFLAAFISMLALFFFAAFIMRWAESYTLLRFMPMRLFPLFTPLFFLFSVVGLFRHIRHGLVSVLLFALALLAFVPAYRAGPGIEQILDTVASWTTEDESVFEAFKWIRQNTPTNAIIAMPPTRKDLWYRTHRATVASFRYPVYSNLTEWRRRINALTGGVSIRSAGTAIEEVEAAYSNLNPRQVIDLRRDFGAEYILTQANYPFRLVYAHREWRLYEIPVNEETAKGTESN